MVDYKKNHQVKNWKLVSFLATIFICLLVFSYFYINKTIEETIKNDFKIYFLRGDRLIFLKRNSSLQDNVSLASKVNKALLELINGPSTNEKLKGIYTEIPYKTKVLNIKQEFSSIIVNFNKDFLDFEGGTNKIQNAIKQIVYTLTDFREVKQVVIAVDGKRDLVIGAEGYIIDKPLTRELWQN